MSRPGARPVATTDRAKRLHTLLGRLRSASAREGGQAEAGPLAAMCDPVLGEFVRSFLVWEASTAKADAALRKLAAACVDINDLRVSLTEEVVSVIGPGYPRAEERAERLKAALHGLFRRENSMSMAHLPEKAKREARVYLTGLPETPSFVADRTFLLALDGHACPADQRLTTRLIQERVLEADTPPEEAASWLERTIRAGDAREAYTLLSGWVDEGSAVLKPARPKGARGTPTPGKRTGPVAARSRRSR